MKSRSFYSATALFAALLVLVGAVGFWRLTANNPRSLLTNGGQAIPVAAQFVPRQSPLMVSLLARPDRLWQLRQLLTPSGQRFLARQEWRSLQDSFEDLTGWDYEIDVRPWLDEETTFAVTAPDLDHDSSNGSQVGYLAILSCRDAEAAREALHLLWQRRAAQGRDLVFEAVSGIALIYDRSPRPLTMTVFGDDDADLPAIQTLASAIIGDRFVLLANDVQVLHQAISTYQAPDVSLANAPNYRKAIAALPSVRVGWLYANVPSLFSWLGVEDPDFQPAIAPIGQTVTEAFVSLRALPAGLIGDVALASFASATDQPQALPAIASPLTLLPQQTQFVTTGNNLAKSLQSFEHSVGGYQLTQQAMSSLSEALSSQAIATTSQLLPMLEGPYAIGKLAGDRNAWFLLAPPPGDVQPLAEVDEFVQSQGLNVSRIALGENKITAWTRLALQSLAQNSPLRLTTEIIGVHTSRQGYEVLTSSLEHLEIFLRENEPMLLDEPTFSHLVKLLDSKSGEVSFINWPDLSPALTRQFAWVRAINTAGQPLTGHIGALAYTETGESPPFKTGRIAINLVDDR